MKNLILLIPLLGLMVSCVEDWGQKDPIPSTAKIPSVTNVGSYTFGEDLFGTDLSTVYTVTSYSSESICEVVEDDEAEYALHIKNAAITIDNDLQGKDCQTGAGVTFWIKQTIEEQDAQIISFESQTKASSEGLQFTANGVLTYNGTSFGEGAFVLDPVGEWHYVALTIKTNGYTVHVDGDLAVEYENDDEADIFAEIIEYITTADVVVVLDDVEETYLSQLNLYNNEITSSQTKRPSLVVKEYVDLLIGSKKFNNAWWSTFSDYFTLEGDGIAHFGFWNYSDGLATWDNWYLVITTPYERDKTGYSEYLVLRSDNWGWGTAYVDGETITVADCANDWATWLADMKDAYVDLTVTRSGGTISIVAVETGASGKEYNYKASISADFPDNVNMFLVCEESYLILKPSEVYLNPTDYSAGSYIVGDESAAFWTQFSDYYTITADQRYPLVFSFYNYSTPTDNWDYWVIVATTPYQRDAATYSEYFVLRSDAWGWGGSYDASGLTSSFNWDTYAADMNGSYHQIGVCRDEATLVVRDRGIKSDGTEFPYYSYQGKVSSTDDINVFFTNEAGYMDIVRVAYMPYFNNFDETEYEW